MLSVLIRGKKRSEFADYFDCLSRNICLCLDFYLQFTFRVEFSALIAVTPIGTKKWKNGSSDRLLYCVCVSTPFSTALAWFVEPRNAQFIWILHTEIWTGLNNYTKTFSGEWKLKIWNLITHDHAAHLELACFAESVLEMEVHSMYYCLLNCIYTFQC